MVKPHVEPDRRIERTVLIDAKICQFLIEPFGVVVAGEELVFLAPIADGPGDAIDELPDGSLSLPGALFAVKVLADDDVGSQLAPFGGYFHVVLFEYRVALFVLDAGGALLPANIFERAPAGCGKNLLDNKPVL